MLTKTIIKVGILLVALCMVIGAIGFFNSMDFKKSLVNFFGFDVKTYAWCPEHTVDFKWLDDSIAAKWKTAKPEEIQSHFCKITLEPIMNVDLTKIALKPILEAQSATAQKALLEWDPETGVFQADGLPFQSSALNKELLSK